jgi:hypothetical protein
MAHFAEINQDNIVLGVFVVENKFLLDEDGVEQESLGIEHIKSVLGQERVFLQTSYNTSEGINFNGGAAIRKNYAAPGMNYNQDIDGFIAPKPFPSWILDELKGAWFAPVPYPDDEPNFYIWNEDILSWELHVPLSEQTVDLNP